MGRTNHSYNGMLSAIARKSLPRFTNYAKDTASLSTIFGNEYSTINKRGNDSLTNIISKDFNTPEEYIKETNVGPIITLNGDRTVTMIAGETYTDLGATSDGGGTVTVDTSNLDTNAVGTYTVSYSATEDRDGINYTRVENRFVNVVAPEEWVPGYTTVPVTLTDKLQPSLNGLALGQKYVFDFSQTRGKDFRLSNDGTTEFTEGVIEAESTLVYTVPDNFNLPLYYYSPNTPNIGGYFWISNVVYSDQGILKIGGVSSLTRGQTYRFYFSSDYGTNVLLALTADGTTFTEGVTTTDTTLTFIVPTKYSPNTIYMKSPTVSGIGSSLSITGALDDGTIYYDNGILKATDITAMERGNTYVLYFSSDYGTSVLLALTADGTTFTEGVTTTDTTLTFIVPTKYSPNTIYMKSPTISGIGSSLSITGALDDGTIYYDNGILKATDITAMERGNTYVLYFSSDYGTNVLLALTADGTTFTEGVTTTDTTLTFIVPTKYSPNTIYMKSPTISGIGSSLSITGALDDGTIYYDNGILKATDITEMERGNTYVLYFSSDYGTNVLLALTADGTTFTEGVTTTDTTLTFIVPTKYSPNTIYMKSPTISGIGSSLSITGALDDGTIYYDNGILKATDITAMERGNTYVLYFSSDYGTNVLLALTADGTTFTEGVTTTDTTLTFIVPTKYSPNTIYMKSPTISGIGSSLSITGALDDGTIYYDNGILKATDITAMERGNTYVLYFSSDYGTNVLLALTADGTTFTEGVTTTDTTLTFIVPTKYSPNTIYMKSPTISGIGSSLSITGALDDGTIYYDNGTLKATGITSLYRGVSNVFYFSSEYGTNIALSTSLNGANLTEGISNTETSLTVTLPSTYPYSTIFIKSLDTPNIGSSLTVPGSLNTGTIYYDNGTLKATGITSLYRGVSNVFYFSSEYGTNIALSTSLNGANLTEGISNTETSLTVTLPSTYPYSTIFIKSLDTPNIGSSLTVPGSLNTGTIYYDNGTLKATGITEIDVGTEYVFYFSSDYGTEILLSLTEDGPTYTEGVTTTDTTLTVTLPSTFTADTIYIKSPNTSGIGSSLTVISGISSWTLKDKISDPSGLNAGFGVFDNASISGDGAWISIGSPDDGGAEGVLGYGNVFMYSKNTDITYSKTQDIAPTTAEQYYFGYKTKISRDGNYLCVIKGNSGIYAGLQMFKRTNNTWSRIASLVQTQYTPLAVELSEDATYIATGNSNNVDEVQIYIKSANDTTVTLLSNINPPEDTLYGIRSISISDNGELLCFGTPYVESNTGNVYVYTSNDNWSSNTYAVIQAPELGGYFGYAVSISGDGNFIAAGLPLYDQVYIYKRSGSSWSLSSTINGPTDYAYGVSVSLSQNADYLVVGSLYASGIYVGDHVYVYYKDGNDNWNLKQTIAGDTGSGFGIFVHTSSEGNYVLATAVEDSADGSSSKANVYVYYGT
jgi:hypothetical protein